MSSPSIGYWASQEQYSMSDLLGFVSQAEASGFTACMTSDHFHPWWHDGGYGNFTWIWLTAAAERTKEMKFVTGVTAPIFRYNPAIIAQAFASLDVLYPGRIALGIGSGEAMNEVSVGFDWVGPEVRLDRTKEALMIISSLWNRNGVDHEGIELNIDSKGFLTFRGKYFKTTKARLYTLPRTRIPIYMAAVGEEATKAAAVFTDGLITVVKPKKSKEVFDIFDKYAVENGKDPNALLKIGKPKFSYHEDYDKAFKSTKFWRASSLEDAFNLDISNPIELEEKAKKEVSDEKLKESVNIVTSIEDCIKPIEEYFKAGYTKVYTHSTSPDESQFIEEFGKKVLPYFSDKKSLPISGPST